MTRSFVGLKLSNEPLNQQVANSSKRISKKKTDLAMMTNDTETRAVVQEVIKGSPAFYSGLQRFYLCCIIIQIVLKLRKNAINIYLFPTQIR